MMTSSLPLKKQKQFTVTKRHVVAFSLITASISLLTGAIGYQAGKKKYASANTEQSTALVYELLPNSQKQAKLEALLLEIDQTQQFSADSDHLFPNEILESEKLTPPVVSTEKTTIEGSAEEMEPPELPKMTVPTSGWAIQVGAYPNLSEAEEHIQRLQEDGLNGYILTASVQGETWYRVRISGYVNKEQAKNAKTDLQTKYQEFDYLVYKAP